MRKALALATCMVAVAAACGGSDSGDSASTDPAPVTEAPPAETDPPETEPVETEPVDSAPVETEPPTEDPEPEPTTAPEPETTSTTEPPPAFNAVALMPLPGAQLDFSGAQVDVPTLVWSAYAGSGGVIVENLGGPIPPGCHGVTFFDPATFDLLQAAGNDAESYAMVGEDGCDLAGQPSMEAVVDGPPVKVNNEHLIQFDFGSLPPPPFDISTQLVNPGGGDGIFRSADPDDLSVINDLSDATHAAGVSGVFEIDQNDGTLRWVDLPAATPGPGCAGGEALCLGDRFQIDIVNDTGDPASAITSSDNGGRFYFFGAHDVNVLVSVLNSCSINNHFWVFAAATTDVAFELTVTDTMAGESQVFSNPLSESPGPVLDTEAFATCP